MLRQSPRNWLSSPMSTELLLSIIGHGRLSNNYIQMSKHLKDINGFKTKTKVFSSSDHKFKISSHDINTEKVNFKGYEAKENISKWVNKNGLTNWDINKYISEPAKYVLLNINNFKMPWYTSKGCEPVMTVYNTFSYTEDVKYEARILEVPLQNREFRVVIFVPNERDVLHNIFEKLIKEGFDAAIKSMQPLFTAVSELNAPNIEFQVSEELSLEQSNCDIPSGTKMSIGDVKINNEGALVNSLTCILSDETNIQTPSTSSTRMDDTTDLFRPFLFAITYKNNPIFTGQYVCTE